MILIFMALGAVIGALSALFGLIFLDITLLAGAGLYFCITFASGGLGVVFMLGRACDAARQPPPFGWTRTY